MGVHEGRAQLAESMKRLNRQWQQTGYAWRDEVARAFEKTYLQPLESDARRALDALDHIAAVLARLQQECE